MAYVAWPTPPLSISDALCAPLALRAVLTVAFQATPLQALWPAVVLAISLPEIFSVFTFESPFGGEPWAIRTDYAEGDLGFDPLELKPKNPAELKAMQTKVSLFKLSVAQNRNTVSACQM